MALDNEGQLWCWGANESGQFGDGTTNSTLAGKRIALPEGVTGWTQVAAGGSFAALDTTGRLFGWGAPEQVMGLEGPFQLKPALLDQGPWTAVAVSKRRLQADEEPWALGIKGDGSLWWLRNPRPTNALATPFSGFKAAPAAGAQSAGEFVEIRGGLGFFLARTASGRLFAAGRNLPGVLGPAGPANAETFTTTLVEVPAPGEGLTWARLAASEAQAFAWDNTGELWIWGTRYENDAFIVDPTPRKVPRPPGGSEWADAGGSGYTAPNTLLLAADGKLWTAGPLEPEWINRMGHGFDVLTSRALLHTPADWTNVRALAASPFHLLVVGGNGRLHAVGYNESHQLGGIPAGGAFSLNPVVPSGDAPFLLGSPPILPTLNLFVGDGLIVEPRSYPDIGGSPGQFTVVRQGRTDLDSIFDIKARVHFKDGSELPEPDVGKTLRKLLVGTAIRDDGTIPLTFYANQTDVVIDLTPNYALFTDGDLVIDLSLVPSDEFNLGTETTGTLEYRYTVPDNYPPTLKVLWPKAPGILFVEGGLDVTLEVADRDGYPAKISANILGSPFGNVATNLTLPAAPKGTSQLIHLPMKLQSPVPTPLDLLISVTDDRGLTTRVRADGFVVMPKAPPAITLRLAGRDLLMPIYWYTSGNFVLDATDDLQVWMPLARYSLSTGLPQSPVEVPDSGGNQRFYRVRPE